LRNIKAPIKCAVAIQLQQRLLRIVLSLRTAFAQAN
jgi:hypothetical protein